jgi:hypothetical protein
MEKYTIEMQYYIGDVLFNLNEINTIRLIKLQGIENWRSELTQTISNNSIKYYNSLFERLDNYWNDDNIKPISIEDIHLFTSTKAKKIVLDLIKH